MSCADPSERMRRALAILEEGIGVEDWFKGIDGFELLIATILSQSTNYKNVRIAMERLRAKVGISPSSIAESDLRAIRDCIRPAGLFNQKAKRIKEVARRILENYGGDVGKLLLSDDPRNELLRLPGVGPKTADVFLAFYGGLNILPVDTHIKRVAKRLGIAEGAGGYEGVRAKLEELIPPHKRRRLHIVLIKFGRSVCKAKAPDCHRCPIAELCPSAKRFLETASGDRG
ncbi:MAG: endonuclease III [Candidatus Bathyarchaeia archaeon]